jgi:hypothetical protein
MRRAISSFARLLAVALAILTAECGSSPMPPAPTPQPNPQPPPNNNPVISSITVQGSRANEPANFADVSESIAIAANVRDDETPVSQLQFNWSAPIGVFSGTGAAVTWSSPPPTQVTATPADVTLTLEVVERYGPPSAPTAFEHRVTATTTVSLHDSVREVSDMSRQFLLEFSDSSIRDVAFIMRNFEPGCYGTEQETDEVADNRMKWRIVNSSVGLPTVTVNFGGVCSFRSRPGDACSRTRVMWDSIRLSDGAHGPPAVGTDQIAAVYVRSKKAWRLCDSQFDGNTPLHMRGFVR